MAHFFFIRMRKRENAFPRLKIGEATVSYGKKHCIEERGFGCNFSLKDVFDWVN